jgi:AraC-type DNA-binding domain-containing proteins
MTTDKLYETLKCRCLTFYKKQSDQLDLLLCGTEQTAPNQCFHAKNRKGYHLHVIMSGKGTLCVEGKEQELHANQIFVTKEGEETWYRASSKDPWCYCWMSFDGTMSESFMNKAGFKKGVNYLDCMLDPYEFYQLVNQVLECPEMTQANDLLHMGKLLEYIALAIRSYEKGNNVNKHRENLNTEDYVRYAREFIINNFAAVGVEDVASYIGINRSYLTKIFKEETGTSPQQFLMDCKMKRAKQLLVETNISIQQVADTVGYDNALSFTKIFKNLFNMSPSTYRITNRNETNDSTLIYEKDN